MNAINQGGGASPLHDLLHLANPLQMHARNFMEAPVFDGNAKNWPKFILDWREYEKMANPNGKATEVEKAVIFERSLPQNLRLEMKAYIGGGSKL